MAKAKLTMVKHGEIVQLRLVNGYQVLESYEFSPQKQLDNYTFFQIAEKLGFDFKKYKRFKNIEWQ